MEASCGSRHVRPTFHPPLRRSFPMRSFAPLLTLFALCASLGDVSACGRRRCAQPVVYCAPCEAYSTQFTYGGPLVVATPLAMKGPTWICANQPVPAGFVVTAQRHDTKCGDSPSAPFVCSGLRIEPVRSGMWVCASSPVPPGYVVTQFARRAECCGLPSAPGVTNAKYIVKP